MQPEKSCRVVAALLFSGVLANCTPVDNPYARIQNPPLVRAKLHTVTVVTPDAGLPQRITEAGYEHESFSNSNYPASAPAEVALWGLPDDPGMGIALFMAFMGHKPDVRLAFKMDVEPLRSADDEVEAAFYRNVLGAELPQWPGSKTLRNGARVQAYTYVVDDLLATKKRFQEAGIPITVEPMALTTAYLGTFQTMAIRAPDGISIQLVQTAAQ